MAVKLTPEARATLEAVAVMTIAAQAATKLPTEVITAVLQAGMQEALKQGLVTVALPEAQATKIARLITTSEKDRQELGALLALLVKKFDDQALGGLAFVALETGPAASYSWYLVDPMVQFSPMLTGMVGALHHAMCARHVDDGEAAVDAEPE